MLIVVVLSLQACLLDAKRLRVGRQSSIVSNLNGDSNVQTAIGTGIETKSCTPKQHQIKYYNELNTNATNSFDGNVFFVFRSKSYGR